MPSSPGSRKTTSSSSPLTTAPSSPQDYHSAPPRQDGAARGLTGAAQTPTTSASDSAGPSRERSLTSSTTPRGIPPGASGQPAPARPSRQHAGTCAGPPR